MSAAAPPKAGGLKFGAEPKKVAILGVLLAVAAGLLISNLSSSDSGSVPAATATHPAAAPATAALPAAHERSPRRHLNQKSSEKNVLRMRTVTLEAQRGDIDPTLRLDLLARLKNVKLAGGERSLFEAGAAPAQAAGNAPPTKIMPGPLPAQSAPGAGAPAAAGPPPVVIPLKFYGFSAPATATGPRAGFFLDGDNIIIANEGEVVKNRYRIVKLAPKSAEVQDMIGKVQQTLPLTPEGAE